VTHARSPVAPNERWHAWTSRIAWIALVGTAFSCEERVSLGSWAQGPPLSSPTSTSAPEGGAAATVTSGGAPNAGAPPELGGEPASLPPPDAGILAPSDAGPPPPVAVPLPACGAVGNPGELNSPGLDVAGTETWTDWNWGTPRESVTWDLMIEQDVPPRLPGTSPIGGYYWHQQFSFAQGVAGRFGLQTEGIYQSDPPDSLADFTKIAVLWLSGPPLDGELGTIPYPDARVAPTAGAGTNWLTIHARFDWEECNVYRFKFGPDEVDDDGNVWYAARIDNMTTGDETLLGRMLLPPDVGALSPYSASRTSPFDFGVASCDELAPVSAIFGPPRFEDESDFATATMNRFSDEACSGSRFTLFEQAVRHEAGVHE